MNGKPLYFELVSISLLLGVGVFLVLLSLPGWGLITIAGLLSILSIGLRHVSSALVAVPATTDTLIERNRSNAS